MRDAATSHNTLVHLFERIHFFLQRLKFYTEIPLTGELMPLLGRVMAQLLSILALSTNITAENKMSELIRFFFCPLVNRGPAKLLKTWMGRTSVEGGLKQLDLLTKSFSVNSNETLVNVNDPNADMAGGIEGGTPTGLGTSRQHCLSVFIYVLTSFSLCFPNSSGGN